MQLKEAILKLDVIQCTLSVMEKQQHILSLVVYASSQLQR